MGKKVYPCPLCGRSVGRRGEPFEDQHKTQSHINGSHDAQHKGEVGEDYIGEIEENAIEKSEMQVDSGRSSKSGPADPSEIMVEMPMAEGEREAMTLEDALGVLGEVAFNPEAFNHTPHSDFETLDGRVDDIAGEVDRHEEQIQELRHAIEYLSDGGVEWDHFGAGEPESDPFA